MAIFVTDPSEDSKVPFLRGILTRSLQQAGMEFEEAYEIADRVRDSLGSDAEITSGQLSKLVAKQLQELGHSEIAKRYLKRSVPLNRITVLDRDGLPQPFSKARLSQGLETCALSEARCYAITAHIEQTLLQRGIREIQSRDLIRLTYEYLLRQESEEVARRYLVWFEFSRSGRPLVLLIGGTTGSGKSTIGAEIAHRLNIIRTQSTDLLREVMRLMVPERLLPALHTSSFSAWKTLPTAEDLTEPTLNGDFEQGFLIQASQVGVAIEGVVSRAETEQISLILEGVHVHPALQNNIRSTSGVIVVPILLAVLKRKQLRKQLKGRGHQVSTRRAERYLEHFDEIWHLQSFLLREADRFNIPIISNTDQDETIKSIMTTIVDRLSEEFAGDPKQMLG
ncbi:MAG: ATP cone domain-containing protein [Rhodothermales bacterium]